MTDRPIIRKGEKGEKAPNGLLTSILLLTDDA